MTHLQNMQNGILTSYPSNNEVRSTTTSCKLLINCIENDLELREFMLNNRPRLIKNPISGVYYYIAPTAEGEGYVSTDCSIVALSGRNRSII